MQKFVMKLVMCAMLALPMYLPYGQVRSTTGTLPTDRGFTGRRLDATGLMFYKVRYYNASLRNGQGTPISGWLNVALAALGCAVYPIPLPTGWLALELPGRRLCDEKSLHTFVCTSFLSANRLR